MNAPQVSVLLPVYNAERFLRQAIESVLQQTFADFELIIINDGSTDASEAIISSYTDPRIIYVKNEKNSGLIFTLNRGIDLARGKYIARMDSDDICYPNRLEKQINYLEQTGADVVASTITVIDETGKELPPWSDDIKYITAGSIHNFLPENNCIAHPSIMAKSNILKEYKYDRLQVEAEDYDLWLRLAADDKSIHKIKEPLLYYRFLSSGLTRKDKMSAFEKLSRTKRRFLRRRIADRKINGFVMKVALHFASDQLKAWIKKGLTRK